MPSAPWKLSTKLGLIGGALLLLALVSIGLTLSVTWQLEGGAAAVNEAGRMRMQTWRLAQALSGGDTTRVAQHLQTFDRSLALLSAGDPSRPLFVPGDQRSQAALAEVRAQWQA
ncbi:MAG TPA: type IV pili methyl-accepting chemotaxis transducer N-terminal domain-containing protein, partial [Rubrivivax sp.]|nr:type IV pili methyl-accepting chemotaxis transducer N-terminal domain-containing protein [Rubrivivax sp.]